MTTDNWQGMDSAPKDGRFVLLIENGYWTGLPSPHLVMGCWKSDWRMSAGGLWTEAARPGIAIQPTHWMPLPKFPLEHEA